METSSIITILGIVLVIILVVWGFMVWSSRRVNLTRTPADQKPEWMRNSPPSETTAATQADGEGLALYDYDKGENVAAPFAEQIEDILRAQLGADPHLSSYEIDLGTGSDGGLEIHVDDKSYTSVEQIPDPRLREAITKAVVTYNQRHK